MSKSRGNVIDPWDVMGTFGADALRWYFFSSGSPWTNRRVSDEGIRESTRRSLVTLWNVFSFFATYADIDGWSPDSDSDLAPRSEPTHVLDRWVRGRLADTVAAVTDGLAGFDALGAASALDRFVDDLSNWYVRRSRPRFWAATGADAAALGTLHRCLVVTAQLLAPFCPFLADDLYTRLTGEESVHLADWPTAEPAVAGGEADEMEAARRLVGLGRTARAEARMRVRQPLRRALLLHPGVALSEEVRAEVADELNVKAIEDVTSLADLMTWRVVPNFRALGPRLGPRVNEVKAALAEADGSEMRRALESQGWVEIAGERLGPDDLEVRADRHEELALAQDGGWAVALDLELDDELRREGKAREVIRALNDLRKRLGLALTDRVRLRVHAAAPRLRDALETHRRWITAEVLATELVVADGPGSSAHEVDIDGDVLAVELSVVDAAA
jgi:isoleucyl-tRNA synthetase